MVQRYLAMAYGIPAATLGLIPDALALPEGALQFQSQYALTTANTRHRRSKADLARTIATWAGTQDCRSGVRAKAALRPVVAGWLGRQVMAHPAQRLTRWGYHSGDIWSEQRTVDGKAHCIAGFRKLIVYADFH